MSTFRVCSFVLLALAACVDGASEPELATEAQELAAAEGQGWDLQGWDLQGWDLQGWDLQGWDLQGWDLQGGSYGNASLNGVIVNGTTLEVWRTLYIAGTPYRAEQRLPDKKCLYSLDKTVSYGCTTYDLATQPSPLAGVKLRGTFTHTSGSTMQVHLRIGASTTTIGAVTKGFGWAMFTLPGNASANGAGCGIVPNGSTNIFTGETCSNPYGCRKNCDLWLYDVDVIMPDGAVSNACPGAQKALAVAGSYSRYGTYSPTATKVTFACESGTIAKCTRWGYRPWGTSRKQCVDCDVTTPTTQYNLVDHHKACVRAAMADYCAKGETFTKNGTLVDIYDYDPTTDALGFIPQTSGLVTGATAFQFESGFDKYGAHQIDYLRYEEVNDTLEAVCPGRFGPGDGGGDVLPRWVRESPSWGLYPTVWIDSTTGCSHSERTPGKWLHHACTTCTYEVSEILPHCVNPDGPGWNDECVAAVDSRCSNSPPMTSHSECTTGAPLPKFATGCTLRVCNANASCCSSTWGSACVDLAKATCTGGLETTGRFGNFCTAGVVVNPPPEPPSPTNSL